MNQFGVSRDGNFKKELPNTSARNRWAIILAGGDGSRLRSLTRLISGDERPKQFCSLFGGVSLLDQTRSRVALAVRPAQTLIVLTKTHEYFYSSLLREVPEQQLVVQPRNAGTAPAILYSLLRISHRNPTALVAVFPSDHYVSDDDAFMSYVENAFESVDLREDLVVLLGIKPKAPETEYGWIEPVSSHLADNPETISWVRRFWEKPTRDVASDLMSRGCYWNSFVMVGTVSAFLKIMKRAVPDLVQRFRVIESMLGKTNHDELVNQLYAQLPNVNFSHDVLAARPGSLAVLPVTNVGWTDLGKPARVLSTMSEFTPAIPFQHLSNLLASAKQPAVDEQRGASTG